MPRHSGCRHAPLGFLLPLQLACLLPCFNFLADSQTIAKPNLFPQFTHSRLSSSSPSVVFRRSVVLLSYLAFSSGLNSVEWHILLERGTFNSFVRGGMICYFGFGFDDFMHGSPLAKDSDLTGSRAASGFQFPFLILRWTPFPSDIWSVQCLSCYNVSTNCIHSRKSAQARFLSHYPLLMIY